jgi:hypothetical protein
MLKAENPGGIWAASEEEHEAGNDDGRGRAEAADAKAPTTSGFASSRVGTFGPSTSEGSSLCMTEGRSCLLFCLGLGDLGLGAREVACLGFFPEDGRRASGVFRLGLPSRCGRGPRRKSWPVALSLVSVRRLFKNEAELPLSATCSFSSVAVVFEATPRMRMLAVNLAQKRSKRAVEESAQQQ